MVKLKQNLKYDSNTGHNETLIVQEEPWCSEKFYIIECNISGISNIWKNNLILIIKVVSKGFFATQNVDLYNIEIIVWYIFLKTMF